MLEQRQNKDTYDECEGRKAAGGRVASSVFAAVNFWHIFNFRTVRRSHAVK